MYYIYIHISIYPLGIFHIVLLQTGIHSLSKLLTSTANKYLQYIVLCGVIYSICFIFYCPKSQFTIQPHYVMLTQDCMHPFFNDDLHCSAPEQGTKSAAPVDWLRVLYSVSCSPHEGEKSTSVPALSETMNLS